MISLKDLDNEELMLGWGDRMSIYNIDERLNMALEICRRAGNTYNARLCNAVHSGRNIDPVVNDAFAKLLPEFYS